MEKTKPNDTVTMDTLKSSSEEPLGSCSCENLEIRQKSTGRYKFIRSIGFGGMKAVLLVLDTDTGREVAMAMMPDAKRRSEKDVANFICEAKLSALLEHPNIVPVYDIGLDLSGAPFYIMKYLRGQSLAAILRRIRNGNESTSRKYKLKEMLRIYVRVCNALDFAHSKGILHLDIKPDNVFIGAYGEVIVLDWGLATTTKGSGLSCVSRVAGQGTPGYMSPEQICGEQESLDVHADIYGLGALLYTMLAYSRPMAGAEVEEALKAACSGTVPPPSSVELTARPVPEALDAVCMKAMSIDPNERYQSVAQLRSDIQKFRDGYATAAQQASPLTQTALFVNRNFWGTLLGGIIIMLLILVIYLLIN